MLEILTLLASLDGRKIPSLYHRHLKSSVVFGTDSYPCSSQAARRDQNRIAQREFRLRKQQRVSVSAERPFHRGH